MLQVSIYLALVTPYICMVIPLHHGLIIPHFMDLLC